MPNRLPIPDELLHLIEKRDADDEDRRSGADRREIELGPLVSVVPPADLGEISLEERRSGDERRKIPDRRRR